VWVLLIESHHVLLLRVDQVEILRHHEICKRKVQLILVLTRKKGGSWKIIEMCQALANFLIYVFVYNLDKQSMISVEVYLLKMKFSRCSLLYKCQWRLIFKFILNLKLHDFIIEHLLKSLWDRCQVGHHLRPQVFLACLQSANKNHSFFVIIDANENIFNFDDLTLLVFENTWCCKELPIRCHNHDVRYVLEAKDIGQERLGGF
jgi:hypothetical protein